MREGLHFAGIYPWWVILSLFAAVMLFSLLSYRLVYRWLPARRRASLVILRFLWLAALTLAVLRPEIQVIQQVRDVPSLIVLVDRSLSMAEKDEPGGRSRYEDALAALESVRPETGLQGCTQSCVHHRDDSIGFEQNHLVHVCVHLDRPDRVVVVLGELAGSHEVVDVSHRPAALRAVRLLPSRKRRDGRRPEGRKRAGTRDAQAPLD